MKIKHNKLRNSGLIYEMLVRQITTDTLNNKDSQALTILKKYFNNTELTKEYRLYSAITSAKNLSEAKATILLDTVLESYKKINKSKVRAEKYNLISEIKESYNLDEFFKPKLDNYKTHASIYLMLEYADNPTVAPSVVSGYKFNILEALSSKEVIKEEDENLVKFSKMAKGERNLVYKIMVSDFNEQFKGLDGRQKLLLKEYIRNISTPDSFREYLNEEIDAIKVDLKRKIRKIGDDVRKVKLQEVLNMLKPLENNKKVTSEDVYNVMSYYELLNEIENVTEA